MRIALISEHASPLACLGGADAGGQNVYVGQLARHLASRGWVVDVFTRRDDESQPLEQPWRSGARVIHVPAGPPRPVRKEALLPYMDAFTDFVGRYARQRSGYDLAHANFFMSALAAVNLKRTLRLPFVVTFHALGKVRRLHQGEADGFPAERIDIEERVTLEADLIIAECPQDEADLVEHYGADQRKLRTVPCGFDPHEFAPLPREEARRCLGLNPAERIILQLGRMVPRKGVDNVIRGAACLRRQHGIATRLLIVGGESRDPDPVHTPEIGRLMQIAAAEGIADSVTFVGSRGRSELRAYYAAADVFVTTPWYEPFGITPVEAMACGAPVVGAAVGGIKATVKHGESGLLVPPKNPDALAAALAQLFTNESLRASLGRNAVTRANALYTWSKVADRVAEVYQEIVRKVKHRSHWASSARSVAAARLAADY
jgi:glycosyltransferase involved in cell wall biosynthesis